MPGAANRGKPQLREIIAIVGNVKNQRLDLQERAGILHSLNATQFWLHGGVPANKHGTTQHHFGSAQRGFLHGSRFPLYDIKTMEEYLASRWLRRASIAAA